MNQFQPGDVVAHKDSPGEEWVVTGFSNNHVAFKSNAQGYPPPCSFWTIYSPSKDLSLIRKAEGSDPVVLSEENQPRPIDQQLSTFRAWFLKKYPYSEDYFQLTYFNHELGFFCTDQKNNPDATDAAWVLRASFEVWQYLQSEIQSLKEQAKEREHVIDRTLDHVTRQIENFKQLKEQESNMHIRNWWQAKVLQVLRPVKRMLENTLGGDHV